MRRLALIALVLPGCMLFFDDGGHRPDRCDLATPAAQEDKPDVAPLELRDPDTLVCEAHGGTCDSECGPCPAVALAPLPSWGMCGSPCEALNESDCAKAAECRVVKDAACMIGLDCLTDFMGCFPTDTAIDDTVKCHSATDGWTCSRNAACTALHRAGANDRTFAICVPEGTSPGLCHDQAVCNSPPPSCPNGTTPGVTNGCWSGACIPLDLCENSV